MLSAAAANSVIKINANKHIINSIANFLSLRTLHPILSALRNIN
jgi:hypothetical protein